MNWREQDQNNTKFKKILNTNIYIHCSKIMIIINHFIMNRQLLINE